MRARWAASVGHRCRPKRQARPEVRPPSPFTDRRLAVGVITALSLITGAFETLTIVAVVAFIDGATRDDLSWEVSVGPIDEVLGSGALMLAAAFFLFGMTFGHLAAAWAKARAVSGWQLQTQKRAVAGFLAASWATQSGLAAGAVQTLMNRIGAAARGLNGLLTLLSSAGAVVMFGVGAILSSPLAASVLLSVGAILMALMRPIRVGSRNASGLTALAQGRVIDGVAEMHALAEEVHVYGSEGAVGDRLSAELAATRRSQRRSAFLTNAGGVLYRSLGIGAVLVGAAVATRQTNLDVARVGVAGLLLLRGLGYGQRIQQSWQNIQNSKPYVNMVGETIEMFEANSSPWGSTEANRLGTFDVENVNYSYGAEEQALHDVSFTLQPGEALGIVGPSGSGKSTLAQVLLRLREPTSGACLVDGVPTAEIRTEDWVRLVALVPQRVQLLGGSVIENIRFDRWWVSEKDVFEAAAAAGLHDEISALPQGYETLLGQGARDLSGGQRQRIGIARALAGNPQLLVLDEPTSALDAISEQHIQSTLESIAGSVSIVIIAHRLNSLNVCDRLLVLEEGRVQAFGSRESLLERSDFFRDAVASQLRRVDNEC